MVNRVVRLTFGQTLAKGIGHVDIRVKNLPSEGTAGAKALSGESAWCICRAARGPARLQQSERGGEELKMRSEK